MTIAGRERNGTRVVLPSIAPVLIAATGWLSGFILPFQMFSRTRMLFESYTALDFATLAAALVGAIVLVSCTRHKPYTLFVLGNACMLVAGLVGLYLAPSVAYGSQHVATIVVMGLQTNPMALHVMLVAFSAITITPAMIDATSRAGGHAAHALAGLGLASALHMVFIPAFGTSSGVFLALAVASSVALLVIGVLSRSRSIDIRVVGENVERAPVTIGPGRTVTTIISWLVFTGLSIASLLVHFRFLGEQREQVTMLSFSVNLMLGSVAATGVASIVCITSRAHVRDTILAIAGPCVASFAACLALYFDITGSFLAGKWFLTGFTMAFALLGYVAGNLSMGNKRSAMLLVTIALLVAGYLSFIPMKTSELVSAESWLYIAFAAVAGLETVNVLIRALVARKKRGT